MRSCPPRSGPGHRAHVAGHVVDGDVQGVVVTEDVVGQRVTDQEQVDPALVDDAGARFVVGGEHDQRGGAITALVAPEARDGDRLAHARPALERAGAPPPAGYLRVRWCQAHAGQTSTS